MRLTFLTPILLAALLAPRAVGALDPGSQLITCDHADERVTLTATSHLDPACTWTRGIEIVASNVTLDCQGAHIAAPDRRYGVHIVAPIDVSLSNITVRNCYIEGFLNNVRIEREGFREAQAAGALPEGSEYDHAFSNILIEDSTSLSSRGVGIFVDGYVTGVTLRNLHVEGADSAGIYLEAGSKDNVVENNVIVNNGYGENGPSGQFFTFGGIDFFFWGTGREGLAIDSSRFNRVTGNYFTGNSAGAIFLYKNCGEFVNQRPERWFHRRYGADGNLIEGNTIVGEDNGVWIASRMGENTAPMDCSDPQYQPGVALDYADDTVVRDNVFENVTFGVRVEDDRAVVTGNQFTSSDPAHEAIVFGTRYRTETLGLPVDGTTITDNRAVITGNTNPYRWIHGHSNTTFSDNLSQGREVGLCEGAQPPTGPFVFVVTFVAADPGDPPVVDPPPTLPPPDPLPPCANGCASGGTVSVSRLVIRKLHTQAGDDTLSLRAQVVLSHPFTPALDPVQVGLGLVIADSTGARAVDVLVPGGAYDSVTRAGWKASRTAPRWKYLNKGTTPPGGITSIIIKDRWAQQLGLVQIRVVGKRGAYAVDPANLPLTALVILDPPTAETGQCAQASFEGPIGMCTADGSSVECRTTS
jgi:hypothetical protein